MEKRQQLQAFILHSSDGTSLPSESCEFTKALGSSSIQATSSMINASTASVRITSLADSASNSRAHQYADKAELSRGEMTRSLKLSAGLP